MDLVVHTTHGCTLGVFITVTCKKLLSDTFSYIVCIVATVDFNRTGVPSIYHINCEILISQGSSRCDHCKKHRKSLCAMASRGRKDGLTDPSSHTNYMYLKTPEKNDRLAQLHKEK